MVRSAAALLAVLILPSFAVGQEPVGTHTVVDDDTLWDLAMFYYENPFDWRVIYEANRDSIADPNLIYPNEVFVIPGLPGQAAQTTVAETPEPMPAAQPAQAPVDLVQFGFRQARPEESVRTVFYTDTSAQNRQMAAGDPNYVAVTRDALYSAPWVVRAGGTADYAGSIHGFADEADQASIIRSFDQVVLTMPSPARVGAELQAFRLKRTIPNIGNVYAPTGIIRVETIGDGTAVGVVTKEYDRILPGDLVRPAPTYSVRQGAYAQEVARGPEAMIMGFAGEQVINNIGHVAFLDLGSDDGIVVGDEFVRFSDAVPTDAQGSLQVVAVTRNMASARILGMDDDIFRQGVIVRLARKMQ